MEETGDHRRHRLFYDGTARHADIVLPAQTVFEHSDICPIGTYTNDGISANHAMIAPIGESRSDYQIYSELARRMGVEQNLHLVWMRWNGFEPSTKTQRIEG